MATSISQWKAEFLKSRSLEQATGMPLYTYRMTSHEFEYLEVTLKEKLVQYLDYYSLGDFSKNIPLFPSLFVIYASEWWRSRYDGSGWSWEPILDSIGLPSENWNQSQRSECVEKGLKDWGLKLVDSRGLRYLGSIAFQGGLPMQLLATSRGNIGRVLSQVLKLAAKGSFEAKDIQEWIRTLSNYLPKAYRQNEIYVLLAEVVLSVLRLKTDANLKSAHGALAVLDAFNPNWRNTFPLPIEDTHAQGLIEQLIRDATEIKVVKFSRKFFIERWLQKVDANWELQSSVHLPDYLDALELKTLFKIDDSSLTRQLTLRFLRGNEVIEIGLRKLAGQERYRLEQKPIDARDISVSSEHSMTLNSGEGEIFYSSIVKGDALSTDLPWLFEVSDSQEAFSLFRQGAGAINSKEAVVCIPHDWEISTENAVNLGCLKFHDRTAWKITDNATIYDTSNRTFRVRCGQAIANNELLELRGSRVREIFSHPNLAFTGVPKLYSISENGLDHQVNGTIGWQFPDGKISDKPNGASGPVEAFWPATGDIKWQSRLVLLPENARFSIEPGETPSVGRLRFSNWGLLGAHIDDQDITTELRRVENDLLLDLSHIGSGSPPEWCELKAIWPGNTNEASLYIPFPAKGVRAIDADGFQLTNKYQLPISSIAGVRLVGFLGEATRAELTISLHRASSSNALFSIRKIIKSNKDQSRLEIRLIDYADEINKLLAGIDALDATVNFQLLVGGASAHTLRIAKYACELIRLQGLPGVGIPLNIFEKYSTDNLAKISIFALRLDAPGDEPIKLEQVYSETVATGNWRFPSQLLTPGPWMIYPEIDSILIFRPLVWSVLQASNNDEADQMIDLSLANALKIPNEHERNEMLDAVVVKLSNDFLDTDWLQVEQLATNLGHLPLSTLDLWRSFTHSAKAMAALAMRLSAFPIGFVERFSMELPWMWEAVSLESWADSIDLLLNQSESNYGLEAGKIVFITHVDRRTQEIPSQNPALRILLELAKAKVTGKITPDMTFSQQSFMENIHAEQLFSGEDCLLQKLLRINADAVWPSDFFDEINKARQGEFARYLCPKSYTFHDVVINLPIILALSSVLNLPLNWLDNTGSMRALRAIRDFDPDWFSEAFDLTVARCLASGLIHIKKES